MVSSLAGDSSRRLLSRRPDQDGDLERHRSGAVGHHGQGLRRARLQAAGRPDARPRPRLRPGQRKDRRQRDEGAAPRRRRDRRSSTTKARSSSRKSSSGSRRCARRWAPASISASSSTARSSRRRRWSLMKALEPYNPWFYEEIVQALNVDVMAELARKTHIPIATGERIFTKWGFKEILEKRAADDSSAGRLLRRRHHRAEDHRGNGGGLLHAARAAQSARARARSRPACRSPRRFPTS